MANELSLNLSAREMVDLNNKVNSFNKTLNEGKVKASNGLDKDDFLEILITQLSHQDPTQPMEDQNFIAQMAQFSSLEQMTNMSTGLTKVADLVSRAQAVSLLGKTVQVADGYGTVNGTVDAVSGMDYPQLLVNGKFFDYSQVLSVLESKEE
jgi:flagellar basal-body rod modification protein FlgD